MLMFNACVRKSDSYLRSEVLQKFVRKSSNERFISIGANRLLDIGVVDMKVLILIRKNKHSGKQNICFADVF